MAEVLRFKLNNKYRNPVSLSAENGNIFSGRNEELRKLKSIITSRTSATVLVGGVRGVGKTTFVRECLRQVKERDGDGHIIADISFADFNEEIDPQKLREKVLKLLIRSLYFALEEDERDEDLKSLYDKTYYSELKETNLIELARDIEASSKETETTERVFKFTVSEEVVKLAKVVLAGVIGTGGSVASVVALDGWWMIGALTAVAALVAMVFKANWETKETTSTENQAIKRASVKSGTSGIAALDLSADTLEIKLREVLEGIASSGKKVIFVVDELDKLSDDGEHLSDHAVFKIIKPLKNLFSLSHAIFLFIGADDFFDRLENERKTNPYSASYTLFTDKLFLTSMYYQDVSALIDTYKEGECLVGDEVTYNKFKAFISWEAKNHIFDTHNLLDSYSEYDGEGNIFVSIKEDDKLNKGNIQEDWETAAGLQVFVAATFENRRYPGINRINEKLYLTLREVSQEAYDTYQVERIDDDYFGILSEVQQKKLKIDSLPAKDREDFDGAIEDLLLRMERSGYAEISEEKDTDDNQKEFTRYTYELSDTEFPNETEIRERNKQLGFEKEYLVEFDALSDQKVKLSRTNLEAFETYAKEYTRFSKIAEPIKTEGRNREPKSRIVQLTERIQSVRQELREAVFKEIVEGVIEDVGGTKLSSAVSETPGQTMWDADPNLSNFYNHLHTKVNEDHYIVIGRGGKYVLVTLDFDQELQDVYLKTSYMKRRNAKTKIINVLYDAEISTKSRQMKWSEIRAKEDFSDTDAFAKKLKDQAKQYLPS